MNKWRPIETAPKDGTLVILGNDDVVWVGKYVAAYRGYSHENPWFSWMLNLRHAKCRHPSTNPDKWMPFPEAE